MACCPCFDSINAPTSRTTLSALAWSCKSVSSTLTTSVARHAVLCSWSSSSLVVLAHCATCGSGFLWLQVKVSRKALLAPPEGVVPEMPFAVGQDVSCVVSEVLPFGAVVKVDTCDSAVDVCCAVRCKLGLHDPPVAVVVAGCLGRSAMQRPQDSFTCQSFNTRAQTRRRMC